MAVRPHHAFLCLVAMGIVALVMFPPTSAGTSDYDVLVDGLSRRSVEHVGDGGTFKLEVMRIDPRKLRVRVLDARKAGRPSMTAKEFCATFGAMVATNGGFFLDKLEPLGLLICDGRETNPLRKADWGVFSITAGVASIVHTKEYRPSETVEQALQAGPRLVVGGVPVKLKPQSARRTVVGIDAEGTIFLMVTTEGVALAEELATLLARPSSKGGLGLEDALNLDGGPSTQMHAEVGDVVIDVPGLSAVPNAVGIFARS